MSSQFAFNELLRELCKHEKIVHVDQLQASGRLLVGKHHVLIMYEEYIDPQSIEVQVDLGEMPEAGSETLLCALMMSNFIYGRCGRSVSSIDPQTGNIVMTMRLPFAPTLTGADLAEDLRRAVRQVDALWAEAMDKLIATSVTESRNHPAMLARSA